MTAPNHFKVNLPLFTGGTTRTLKNGTITKPTKKYWLSMNNYRNWDPRASNNQKIRFKEQIMDQIVQLPNLSLLWGTITIHYRFFPPNRQSRDIGNYVAVVDKFFCDALVEQGKIEDDNMNILKRSSWEMGNIDRENPRMEAFIVSYAPFDIESKL